MTTRIAIGSLVRGLIGFMNLLNSLFLSLMLLKESDSVHQALKRIHCLPLGPEIQSPQEPEINQENRGNHGEL